MRIHFQGGPLTWLLTQGLSRTGGVKEELIPAWEIREGFPEEVTPAPKLVVEYKWA